MSSLGKASSGFISHHKKNESPPSYNQVFHMDNIATAPLLHETFLGSIFGTATNFQFEWDSDSSDNYSFIIRDTSGYLQAKGNVGNLNTTLQNINGSEMLKIFKSDSIIEGKPTFEVHDNNACIGYVTFAEAGDGLQIHPKNNGSQIIVRSLKLGDFAMFRDHSSPIPICNIYMPNSNVYASREFNGTIMFLPESGITKEEQFLCTAAAIVFKVSMKEITTRANTAATAMVAAQNASAKCQSYILGCLFVAAIIAVIIVFVMALQKRTCEKRKLLKYEGYENMQC